MSFYLLNAFEDAEDLNRMGAILFVLCILWLILALSNDGKKVKETKGPPDHITDREIDEYLY